MSDKLTKDRRAMIIQKEIPVDFEVQIDEHIYSFSLKEEIYLKSEVESSGSISSWYSTFHPFKYTDDVVFMFDSRDGRWRYAQDEIQKAYKNAIANNALLGV